MVSKKYKNIQKLRHEYQGTQDEREKLEGPTYNRRVNRKIKTNGIGVNGVKGIRRKNASAIQQPRKRAYLKRKRRVLFINF
jgi:predicted RNase H-like nuclease (RuvC/YqgF family)